MQVSTRLDSPGSNRKHRRSLTATALTALVLASVPAVSSAVEPTPPALPPLVVTSVHSDYVTGVTVDVEEVPGVNYASFVVAPSGIENVEAHRDQHLDRIPIRLVPEENWDTQVRVPTCVVNDSGAASLSLYRVYQRASDAPRVQDEVVLDIDRAALARPAAPPALRVVGPRTWGFYSSPGLGYYGQPAVAVLSDNVPDFCGTISATTTIPDLPSQDIPTFYDADPRQFARRTWAYPLIYFERPEPGRYANTFTLSTQPGIPGDGLSIPWDVEVTRQTSELGNSFIRVPTTRYTGLYRVQPVPVGVMEAPYSMPGAQVAVKIYRGNQVVWYSGVQTVARLDRVFRLPALPRGSYTVVSGYAGDTRWAPSSATRTFTVR